MMKKTIQLLSALLLVCASTARANDALDLDMEVEQIDKSAKRTGERDAGFVIVAKRTGVPVATLRKQGEETKLSPGNLFIAHTLAAETGKDFDVIVEMKKSGEGWGKIAKAHGVKLGPLVSEARKLVKEQERGAKDSARIAHGPSEERAKGTSQESKSQSESARNGKTKAGKGKSGKN